MTTPLLLAPCGFDPVHACCPDWDTADPTVQEAAHDWAVYVLWALTGRQYGACAVTVRPCYQPPGLGTYRDYGVWMDTSAGGDSMWMPYVGTDGLWRNCGCGGPCCCGARCEVWLPPPVGEVLEVSIGGVALPGGYRVDNKTFLVREDGGCWPECQDFDAPATGPGGFTVSYVWGKPLPAAGRIALGALECEYAKLCMGQPCALSPEVTSISRDGVSFDIRPQGADKDHPTGVAAVDLFIRTTNPNHLMEDVGVSSPDAPAPRTATFTAP